MDPKSEPKLAVAAAVHGVVTDLLHQHQHAYAHFPESVDLAVYGMGLGMLQSQFDFVTKDGTFWDSTQWRLFPRPFLDQTGQAWTHAIVASMRRDKNPEWLEDLGSDQRRNVTKSMKYLSQAGDCFVSADHSCEKTQRQWLETADSKFSSTALIAVRHLQSDPELATEQQALICGKLRSTETAIVLNTIAACEQVGEPSPEVTEELQFLTRHRDDEVRAKSMLALARLGKLNETCLETAGQFLDSKTKHVTFAGLMAVSTLESVEGDLLAPINRGFLRALSDCNYEFVNLFAGAFVRWFEDPKAYVTQALQPTHEEYVQIAIEAIDNVGKGMVEIDSNAA